MGISLQTLAHEPSGSSEKIDFSAIKKTKLERLDKMRTCISNSTNLEQLRACKRKRKN